MNTCIWCEEAESGQILESETESRNRVCEEVSTYGINLSPPVCSTLDTMGGLGHCTHSLYTVRSGLENSGKDPHGTQVL